MVDPEVLEVGNIQHVVASPTVRIDDAVRHYLTLHDRHQRGAGGIGNDLRVDLATSLQQAENRDFPRCTTASHTFALATEIAFVHFDLAAEHGFAFGLQFQSDDLTQPKKEISGRLTVYAT